MVYSDIPPYDILKNDQLSFEDIQQMKRFSRFWNLYYNSGNFKDSVALLWPAGDVFEQFHAFSLWVYKQTQSTWKISLDRLAKLLFDYLTNKLGYEEQATAEMLIHDIMKLGGRKMPNFLKPFAHGKPELKQVGGIGHNKRQVRHL